MKTLTVHAHGHDLQVRDSGPNSKVLRAWRQGHVYEHGLLEHIYEQDYTGIAIDVGAGIGTHTIWFTRVCGLTTAWVEPNEDAYSSTVVNLLLNQVPSTMHHGWPVMLGDGQTGVRIDDVGVQRVGLIKIDVEGMEPDVLKGAEQTIKRDHPDIYAEEWHQAAHDAIANVLEPIGYHMTKLFRMGTNLGKWEHGG